MRWSWAQLGHKPLRLLLGHLKGIEKRPYYSTASRPVMLNGKGAYGSRLVVDGFPRDGIATPSLGSAVALRP